jgi:ComF family protein
MGPQRIDDQDIDRRRAISPLEAIYPAKCALCGALSGSAVCAECRSEFREHEPAIRPGDGPLESIATLFDYSGRAAQAVQRLKYERVTSLGPWMSDALAEFAGRAGLGRFDVVAPVPIHWSRRCFRGFNQSELLAEAFPQTQLSMLRFRRTRPQVGLSVEQRLENLRGAFRASSDAEGKAVLLVDDVITSGGTARECASALREAGALNVAAIAFCGAKPERHTE